MRKCLVLLLAVVLAGGLFACGDGDEPQTAMIASEPTTSSTTAVMVSSTHQPTQITFMPEDIRLQERYALDRLDTSKRYVYSTCFGEAHDLFPMHAYDEMHEARMRYYGEPETEMALVTLIKKYGIPKEKFEEAIRKEAEYRISVGRDLSSEYGELPNADIVYTFDNEIINAYYRRKNPVVPDWSKVKTYESYSAFLAANPE